MSITDLDRLLLTLDSKRQCTVAALNQMRAGGSLRASVILLSNMRRASTALGPAVQSLLHELLQTQIAPCASMAGMAAAPALAALSKPTSKSSQHQLILQQSTQHVTRTFHSSSCSNNNSKSKRSKTLGDSSPHHKGPSKSYRRQQQQQQQHPTSTPGSPWPQPSRLVLPDRKAVVPVLGRVPPSSRAAAAATASMIKGAAEAASAISDAAEPAAAQQKPGIHVTGSSALPDVAPAAAAAANDSSSSSGAVMTSSGPARAAAYPWDVVSCLTQSSPYTLERMAAAHINTYLAYLRDARRGMPSVFELGVARHQGRKGRSHLLRRELLLRHFLQHLASELAAAGGTAAARVVTDEQVQEADQELLAAAAVSAAAGSVFCAGATADEVGECLMDYFVMKQCMQLMLYQRQHRQLMQQKYLQQQRQQHEGDSGSSRHEAAAELFHQEAEEVDVFDAFFDADLTDYQEYLAAAAAGQPSVFTTVNPFVNTTHLQQQQQQQQQDLTAARQELATAAAMLSKLPANIKGRPLLHITSIHILQLAVDVGVAPESVIEVLDGFYRLKRLGFRQALEQLIEAADDDAPLQRF